VIAHGMHDAVLWFTVLGDKLGPVLDEDDSSIDKALRSYEREGDGGALPSVYLAGRYTRTHSLAGPESELWKELETSPSFIQEFGNAYTRTLSLERLFSFRRLARWAAKSMIH